MQTMLLIRGKPPLDNMKTDTPETDAEIMKILINRGVADCRNVPENLVKKSRILERGRNEAFRLLRVIEEGHRNIKSRPLYHGCDTDPCEWCSQARRILAESAKSASADISDQKS